MVPIALPTIPGQRGPLCAPCECEGWLTCRLNCLALTLPPDTQTSREVRQRQSLHVAVIVASFGIH